MKKSTKLWIAGIAAVIVVVAVIVGVKVKEKPKPNPNPDTNEKTEKDIGDDIESDKPYEGDGLTIGEEKESPVQSIETPTSWNENTNAETIDKSDDKTQETTDSTDKTDKTDTSDSTDSDVSKGDILEGESWTKPR